MLRNRRKKNCLEFHQRRWMLTTLRFQSYLCIVILYMIVILLHLQFQIVSLHHRVLIRTAQLYSSEAPFTLSYT